MEFIPSKRKGKYNAKGFLLKENTLTFFPSGADDPIPFDLSLDSIEGIIVSKECTDMDDIAMDFLFPNLQSIEVEDGNPIYSVCKGSNVLMKKDGFLVLGCKASIIPESCLAIGHMAFRKIENMESLFIPKGVKTIFEDSFDTLPALKRIRVDKENAYYDSREDCNGIIEKKTGALIYAVADTKIPDGVTMIDPNCYHNVLDLTSLSLPETVRIIGRGAFSGCDGLKDIVIPKNIIRIDRYAFSRCKNLTSVYFPFSTAHIERKSFSGCPKLCSITFQIKNPNYSPQKAIAGIFQSKEKALYVGTRRSSLDRNIKTICDCALEGTHGLEKLEIPSGVSRIEIKEDNIHSRNLRQIEVNPNNPTYECKGNSNTIVERKSHTLILGCQSSFVPIGVREIGPKAFMHVKGLKSIIIPSSVRTISPFAFSDTDIEEVEIQEGVETISEYAFSDTPNLKRIILPKSLSFISDHAFENSGLEQIDLPMVKAVGRYCFKDCVHLKEISLHDGLLALFEGAFENCRSLESLTLPKTVERIHSYVLNGCASLLEFEVPRNCDSILFPLYKTGNHLKRITVHPKNRYFDCPENGNCIYDFRNGKLILGCADTRFSEEIHTIAQGAFEGLDDLREMVIPEGIETIHDEAFGQCPNLRILHLPSSLKHVSDSFSDNSRNLLEIHLSSKPKDFALYRKKNPQVKFILDFKDSAINQQR